MSTLNAEEDRAARVVSQVVTMAQGGTGHVAVPDAAMRGTAYTNVGRRAAVGPSGRPVRKAIGPTI